MKIYSVMRYVYRLCCKHLMISDTNPTDYPIDYMVDYLADYLADCPVIVVLEYFCWASGESNR